MFPPSQQRIMVTDAKSGIGHLPAERTSISVRSRTEGPSALYIPPLAVFFEG